MAAELAATHALNCADTSHKQEKVRCSISLSVSH
jgi:hypothetical protein